MHTQSLQSSTSATGFQYWPTLRTGPVWHERARWLNGVIVLAH